MLKNFIRCYPGIGVAVIFGQLLLLIAAFVTISLNMEAISTMQSAQEARAAAVLSSDLREMVQIAEDDTLSANQKRLVLYQKTQSALESLAASGYTSEIKQDLTEVLNGLSHHLSEMQDQTSIEILLDGDERAFLHLFGSNPVIEAYGIYKTTRHPTARTSAESALSDPKPLCHFKRPMAEEHEGERCANRIFGVNGVLHQAGDRLYTCANAYAILDSAELYPLEASLACEEAEAQFTAAECFTSAEDFLRSAYPKWVWKTLTAVSECDCGPFVEVTYRGDAVTVWIRVSKANGRMTDVRSEIV